MDTEIENIMLNKLKKDENAYNILQNQFIDCRSGLKEKFDYVLIDKSNSNKIGIDIVDDDVELRVRLMFSKKIDCDLSDAIVISNISIRDSDSNLSKSLGVKLFENVEQSETAPFGLAKLDRILKGGPISDRVYMISGETGTGKTILGTKFILSGAENGKKGMIILTSTPVNAFLVDMATISKNFEKYYKCGMISIYSLSEQVNELKSQARISDTNYRKMLTKLTSQIIDILVKENAKRLLIDNVTLILIPDDDYISTFFNTPPTKGLTTVVTSEVRANRLSYYGIEEFYVSGVIRLTKEFVNDDLTRKLYIEKMRGINFEPKPLEFKLDEKGIQFL